MFHTPADIIRQPPARERYRVGRAALREIATIRDAGHLAPVESSVDRRKWTYARQSGRRRAALQNVGHRVARSTIRRVLQAAGLPPVLLRPTGQTFLRARGVHRRRRFLHNGSLDVARFVTNYTVIIGDLAFGACVSIPSRSSCSRSCGR